MLKRLLVTGGAGFIGSHFIEHCLSETDAYVVNLDKLGIGSSAEFAYQMQSHPRYHFIHGNMADRNLVDDIFKQHQIDTVVHFAAESHVDRSIASPVAFTENNILGTACLLEAARSAWQANLTDKRFHHISTDEVYGDIPLDAEPIKEGAAYHPSSPYAASKASADHLCLAYHRTYDLPITLSQCTNNYGPRQHAEKFIPTILSKLTAGLAVPIYGDGQNVRDWLYVRDHARAIWQILSRGQVGESYHVSAQCELSNLAITEKIYALLEKTLHASALPAKSQSLAWVADRLGHDRRYALNADKLRQELAWQAQTSLEAGLIETINEWFHLPASID